jgi:hypothetical protein
MKTLEGNQPNRNLSFFKGIISSLQMFKQETLEFQMGVQLIANIKHRKPSNFSSQPLPLYLPLHTSPHFAGYNPLLVYAGTRSPYHPNIT